MATLVIGELNPFVASLANQLEAKSLISTVQDSNKNWLNEKETVFYGCPDNEQLVRSILDSQKISTVVYVPPGLGHVASGKQQETVDHAKKQLLGITHFLDGWRKSKNFEEKTLIFVSCFAVYGQQEDPDNKTSLKPSTQLGAALAASEALLHSYAVSYKLNIKILRLRSADPPNYLEDIVLALNILKEHKEGVATVFHMPSDTAADFSDQYVDNLVSIPGWKELSGDANWLNSQLSKSVVSAARFLIYGSKGWIGEQFVALLKSREIEYISSSTRPGTDPEGVVAEEITRVAPSHVVSMIGRTHGPGCGNIDYLEGGADKLNENVRDNLYAPWTLANLCQKFNLHFTYVGTGCLFEYTPEHPRGGPGYDEKEQPNFAGNKYSVVKGFTDQSLGFFKNTLNARIRLPINGEDSPRNLLKKLIGFKQVLDVPNSITYLPDCLPILLNLALRQETGALNLVNPGSITFPRILEIYEQETGNKLEFDVVPADENSAAVKTRAHCTLDTSRLQALVPGVLDSQSAVRRAVETLASHLQ